MTVYQQQTMQRIEIIQDLQMRSLLARLPGCTPSKWLSVATLTDAHHIRYATIKALVKAGYLTMRQTDGWGPDVIPSHNLIPAAGPDPMHFYNRHED